MSDDSKVIELASRRPPQETSGAPPGSGPAPAGSLVEGLFPGTVWPPHILDMLSKAQRARAEAEAKLERLIDLSERFKPYEPRGGLRFPIFHADELEPIRKLRGGGFKIVDLLWQQGDHIPGYHIEKVLARCGLLVQYKSGGPLRGVDLHVPLIHPRIEKAFAKVPDFAKRLMPLAVDFFIPERSAYHILDAEDLWGARLVFALPTEAEKAAGI